MATAHSSNNPFLQPALPLLAACLLTSDECVLTNVPRISDVE